MNRLPSKLLSTDLVTYKDSCQPQTIMRKLILESLESYYASHEKKKKKKRRKNMRFHVTSYGGYLGMKYYS